MGRGNGDCAGDLGSGDLASVDVARHHVYVATAALMTPQQKKARQFKKRLFAGFFTHKERVKAYSFLLALGEHFITLSEVYREKGFRARDCAAQEQIDFYQQAFSMVAGEIGLLAQTSGIPNDIQRREQGRQRIDEQNRENSSVYGTEHPHLGKLRELEAELEQRTARRATSVDASPATVPSAGPSVASPQGDKGPDAEASPNATRVDPSGADSDH